MKNGRGRSLAARASTSARRSGRCTTPETQAQAARFRSDAVRTVRRCWRRDGAAVVRWAPAIRGDGPRWRRQAWRGDPGVADGGLASSGGEWPQAWRHSPPAASMRRRAVAGLPDARRPRPDAVQPTVTNPRVWNDESNQLGWGAYLGGRAGGDVPVDSAPVRVEELSVCRRPGWAPQDSTFSATRTSCPVGSTPPASLRSCTCTRAPCTCTDSNCSHPSSHWTAGSSKSAATRWTSSRSANGLVTTPSRTATSYGQTPQRRSMLTVTFKPSA